MHKIIYFYLLFSLIAISPAYAYIDPGTGSMLLQGLIGGIAAGLTFISVYYKKIKDFLYNIFYKRQPVKDSDVGDKN